MEIAISMNSQSRKSVSNPGKKQFVNNPIRIEEKIEMTMNLNSNGH